MFEKRQSEVLVVGAGPVGLLTALLFAEKGIHVQVVEEQWRTASRSYALALHPASLRLLGELGLTESVVKMGYRVDELVFHDQLEPCGRLKFTDLGGDFPFVLVLPQEGLEALLRRRLEKRRVKVLWNHRMSELKADGDWVEARIEKLGKDSSGYSVARTEWVVDKVFEVRANFVVGADGHHSAVRGALGLDFEAVGNPHTFAVFEFESDGDAGHEMQIVFEERGTSVLWPMGNGRFRWSFELEDPEQVLDPRVKSRLFVQLRDEPYPHIAEDRLVELIGTRAPWFQAHVREVMWSAAIRFEKRLAQRFGGHRTWLVGDAAHLAFPVGIQSMNVGFREASRLARKMVGVLRGGRSLDSLQGYESDSFAEWRQLLGLAGSPAIGVGAPNWVKAYADRIPACIPASGDDLAKLLNGIGLQLAD